MSNYEYIYNQVCQKFTLSDLESSDYTLVSPDIATKIYCGMDKFLNPSLYVVTSIKPKEMSSTSLIKVTVVKRNIDDNYGIIFSLLDESLMEIFFRFCSDLISVTLTATNEYDAISSLCRRYVQWQKMLRLKKGKLLTEEEIKGMTGELLFLKEYLAKTHGYKKAVDSWIGVDYADQDFVIDDYWYEIKTISSGIDTVTISSLEQLDSDTKGSLVILTFDKTSPNNINKITISKLLSEIKLEMDDDKLFEKIEEKLFDFGYVELPDYEKYAYIKNNVDFFEVNDKFPIIRKSDLPRSVLRVKYDLIISMLDEWRYNYG